MLFAYFLSLNNPRAPKARWSNENTALFKHFTYGRIQETDLCFLIESGEVLCSTHQHDGQLGELNGES